MLQGDSDSLDCAAILGVLKRRFSLVPGERISPSAGKFAHAGIKGGIFHLRQGLPAIGSALGDQGYDGQVATAVQVLRKFHQTYFEIRTSREFVWIGFSGLYRFAFIGKGRVSRVTRLQPGFVVATSLC